MNSPRYFYFSPPPHHPHAEEEVEGVSVCVKGWGGEGGEEGVAVSPREGSANPREQKTHPYSAGGFCLP